MPSFITLKTLFIALVISLITLVFVLSAQTYIKVAVILIAGYVIAYIMWPKKNYEKQMTHLAKLSGGKANTGAHGSADFSGAKDIKTSGLFPKKGFILGKFNDRFIRFDRPGHLITFAPTRSGKGVGHVIPNLLDHPGSVVVNDIKGENFAVSAKHRAKFTDVHAFAPFGEESSCYNPLDFIRIGTEYELDDVALIVDMIILEEGKDPFWEREAKNLVTALMLHVATSAPPALRNMGEVRYLLMQSKKEMDYTVKEMTRSPNPHVKKMAAAISATEPKVLSSIMSVAKSQTSVWDSPKLKAITSRSDFDPAEIKKKPTSLYIIIPPEYLDVYKPVIRMMIGITIAAAMRIKGKPEHPIMFLIDEFPALGYMKNIEVGIGYLAGYGVSLWMFIQDLSQLRDNYPKWESFIANCSARMAFGTNDIDTAKTLSDMLGTTTIKVDSSSKSNDGGWFSKASSSSTSSSETSRALMTPDEVMRLPHDCQLIFIQGIKPIIAEKIFYFKDKFFDGKFGKWDG